jgi:ABC-type uncharacterized transport system permease subunit
MILSSSTLTLAPGGDTLLAAVTLVLYVAAALPLQALRRFAAAALLGAWALHLLLLAIDIGGLGQAQGGMRWGFGPVLSMTVWLMIAVHTVESRFLPLPAVRLALAAAGVVGVLAALLFPGDLRHGHSALAPLHFALGVGSYGLFAAAVLHASLLDRAERRLRPGAASGNRPVAPLAPPGQAFGLPLLQLERLTFRFVEAGFVVLTATLLLGMATMSQWRWGDHKAVFSLLAWGVFAGLIAGRHLRGWRGRRATRWLYVGAALLLLAYVGSRFVFEVLLGRAPA